METTAAYESPSLTKKIKTEAQDESPPKTQDQVATDHTNFNFQKSCVHSTKMETTTNVPPAVKKIKMEELPLESPTNVPPAVKKIKMEELPLESPTSQEMKIYMKVMKTITMGVNSSDSIEDVKAKYRDMMGETSNDQRELFFAGDRLKDDKNLIDYGVQDGSTVHMFLHSEAKMQIRIMMNFGMDVKFNVLKCDTIGKVIAMLQDNSEFLKTQLEYLVYNGKELEDCQTLAFYNIQHDSIVHAVTFDELVCFNIDVLTADYGMISFKVNASYTIKDVKLTIENMLGISVEVQKLSMGTGDLDDYMTLREYDVIKYTEMQLVKPY